jgi:hypothetical protein
MTGYAWSLPEALRRLADALRRHGEALLDPGASKQLDRIDIE